MKNFYLRSKIDAAFFGGADKILRPGKKSSPAVGRGGGGGAPLCLGRGLCPGRAAGLFWSKPGKTGLGIKNEGGDLEGPAYHGARVR